MTPAPVPSTPSPIGSSELELSIERAAAAAVPGGTITPLTPTQLPGAPPVQIARANQYRLNFQAAQGQQFTLRRIFLSLPLLLEEKEMEETNSVNGTATNYQAAEEADNAGAGKEGQPREASNTSQGNYSDPAIFDLTSYEYEVETAAGPPFLVVQKETIRARRSILPITATLIAALYGPAGVLWFEAFEVPLHTINNATLGQYIGIGRIGAYADLTNPIQLRPDQEVYGFGFEIFIPTKPSTTVSVGQELTEAQQKKPGPGLVTLFYDIENADLGK